MENLPFRGIQPSHRRCRRLTGASSHSHVLTVTSSRTVSLPETEWEDLGFFSSSPQSLAPEEEALPLGQFPTCPGQGRKVGSTSSFPERERSQRIFSPCYHQCGNFTS